MTVPMPFHLNHSMVWAESRCLILILWSFPQRVRNFAQTKYRAPLLQSRAALPQKYGGKRQANTGSAGALTRNERAARNIYRVKSFEIEHASHALAGEGAALPVLTGSFQIGSIILPTPSRSVIRLPHFLRDILGQHFRPASRRQSLVSALTETVGQRQGVLAPATALRQNHPFEIDRALSKKEAPLRSLSGGAWNLTQSLCFKATVVCVD
jgi:hypothetical protein